MRRSSPIVSLFAVALTVAVVSTCHAEASFVPGEVLVRWAGETGAARRTALREGLGATLIERFEFVGVERLAVAGDPVAAAAALASRPGVMYAEPNWIWTASRRPNDPAYGQLWGLRNVGQTGGTAGADVKAEAAWEFTTGESGLLVGVIDSGIDWNHPDLAANVWTNPGEVAGNGVDDDGNGYVDDLHGWDFANRDASPMDDNGHGTHVSGTLAAVGDNGVGVTGVAWRAKLVALKFLNASGSGNSADAIAAIQYAIRIGVRVLNNSWGGGPYSQALRDAIGAADAAGIVFVAAAGNSGIDSDAIRVYPAGYDLPNVISVAATDHNDQLAPFSNWGLTTVDVAAPGVDVYSTWPNRQYQPLSGTSMATPYVSGACALLLGRHPEMPAAQVRERILASAHRVPGLATRLVSGARLDVSLAVANPDTIAPGGIADLTIDAAGSTSLDLAWTETGDDGALGQPTSLELRWSTSPLDSANFEAATLAALAPPLAAGAREHARLHGLPIATTVWVALRARDEFGNPGPLSNVASAVTLGPPIARIEPAAVGGELRTGETLDHEVVLRNDSDGTLEWRAPTPVIELGGDAMEAAAWPLEPVAKGVDGSARGPQAAASGGPDAFGYRWLDSAAPGGPAYAWLDIERPEWQVELTGDDALSAELPLGFTFPFYGRRHAAVRVCTNGYLSFVDGAVPYVNSGLPSAQGARAMIAPCWDDLNFGASTRRAYAHYDGVRFVVTWLDVPRYADPASTQTFQVILWPSGEIRFQYRSGTGVRNNCTVGMQDSTRTTGLTVSFNQDYLRDSLAVRLLPLRQWLGVSPDSGFLAPGEHATLRVRMDAAGLPTGVYRGAVHVRSNDPVTPDVGVSATLQVDGAPDALFAPAAIDFGDVYVGAAETLAVHIENGGVDDLHLLWKADGDPFTLEFAPAVLKPGEVVSLPLVFRPALPGAYDRAIDVACDDPDNGLLRVSVRARALPPPLAWWSADSLAAVGANGMGAAQRERVATLRVRNDGESPLHWRAFAESALPAEAGGPARRSGPFVSGGPDAGGYRWIDSDTPGGPAFAWQEISGVGARVFGSADDSTRTDLELPFDFPFYGHTYRRVNVCTNGWLSFVDRGRSFRDVALPDTSAPRALIAPLWDDLDLRTTTGGGRAWTHFDGSRFVIEWQDAVHYAVGGPYTFQVLLAPNGTIEFQYLAVAAPSDRATIGVQDESGTRGFTLAHDEPYAHAGLRVRVQRLPDWLAAEPDTGVVAPGAEDTVRVRFRADGVEDGVHEGALELLSDDVTRPRRVVPARFVVSRTDLALTALDVIGALAHGPLVRLEGAASEAFESLVPALSSLGGVSPLGPPLASPGGLALPFAAIDLLRAGLPGGPGPVPFAGLSGGRTWFSDSVLLQIARPPLEVVGLPAWDAGVATVQARSGMPISLGFSPPALVERYEVALSLDGGRQWTSLAVTPSPGWVFTPLVVSDGSLLEVSAWHGDSLTGAWLSAPIAVSGPSGTGVDGEAPARFSLRLLGARAGDLPVRLELDLPQPARDVRVELFDVAGARVRVLAQGALAAGTHAFGWDGRHASGAAAASGVYFVRASAGGRAAVRRIVLAR